MFCKKKKKKKILEILPIYNLKLKTFLNQTKTVSLRAKKKKKKKKKKKHFHHPLKTVS